MATVDWLTYRHPLGTLVTNEEAGLLADARLDDCRKRDGLDDVPRRRKGPTIPSVWTLVLDIVARTAYQT